MQCRICFEEDGILLSPCSCRGTSAYIHQRCLDTYIEHYPDRICRVCNQPMKMSIQKFQILKFCLLFLILIFLVMTSTAPVYMKVLFTIALVSLFVYYSYNELIDDKHGVVILCICTLFLSGGEKYSIMAIIIGLFSLAFLCSLQVFVPLQYLIIVGVNFVVLVYSLMITITLFPFLDHIAFTVYLCVLYLLWYPWATRLRL